LGYDRATTTILSTFNAAGDAVASDEPQQLTSNLIIELGMSRAESSAPAPIMMNCPKEITGSLNEDCIAATADDDDDADNVDENDRYIHAALSSSVDAMTSDGFADLLRTFEDESLEDQFDTRELPPASDHMHLTSSANRNLSSHAAVDIFRTSFSSRSDHDHQNRELPHAASATITGRSRDPFLCLPISHPSIVSALGPTQLVFSL
jgi:hypothetical protein